MTAAGADDIAARLKAGAWRFELHLSMTRHHVLQSRSEVDPRVRMTTVTPKRGACARLTFHFEDNDVDIEPGGRSAVLLGSHEFDTLEALSAAIARHDGEIAAERAWGAAAPPESADRFNRRGER